MVNKRSNKSKRGDKSSLTWALIFRLKIQVYNEEYLFFRKEKNMLEYSVLILSLSVIAAIGSVIDLIWIIKNKSSK